MASGKEAGAPPGRTEPPTPDVPEGLAAAAPVENGEMKRYGTKAADATTQFALRNPLLVSPAAAASRFPPCAVPPHAVPAPRVASPALNPLAPARLQAAFIPDALENAVDALLPDSFEAKMEGSAQRMARE